MELKEGGVVINKDSFKKVEKVKGVFPMEYKAFMIEHNGGHPVNRFVFSFMDYDSEAEKHFENGFDIYSFNKLEDIPDFYDNLYSPNLIPNHYCPIADDFDSFIQNLKNDG